MTTNRSTYHPINCEFHDLLEDLAVTRKPALISFLDGTGAVQRRNVTINDVYASDGAEYLSMSTEEIVRLDQLMEVGEARLADYFRASSWLPGTDCGPTMLSDRGDGRSSDASSCPSKAIGFATRTKK